MRTRRLVMPFIVLLGTIAAGCGSSDESAAPDRGSPGSQPPVIDLTGAVARSYPAGPDQTTCTRGLPYGGDDEGFLSVAVIDPEYRISFEEPPGEPNTVGLSVTVTGPKAADAWPVGTFETGETGGHDVDVRVTPGAIRPDSMGNEPDMHASSSVGEADVGRYKVTISADGLTGTVEAETVDIYGSEAPIKVSGSWRCER